MDKKFEDGRIYERTTSNIGIEARIVSERSDSIPINEEDRSRYMCMLAEIDTINRLKQQYYPLGDAMSDAVLKNARSEMRKLEKLFGKEEVKRLKQKYQELVESCAKLRS